MADANKGKAPDMKAAFEEVLEILQTTQPQEVGPEGVDMDEVIERLEDALSKLNEHMEKVYENTGMTKEELETYANDPKNFSSDEWSLLNKIRTELNEFQEQTERTLHEIEEGTVTAGAPKGKKKGKKRRKEGVPS